MQRKLAPLFIALSAAACVPPTDPVAESEQAAWWVSETCTDKIDWYPISEQPYGQAIRLSESPFLREVHELDQDQDSVRDDAESAFMRAFRPFLEFDEDEHAWPGMNVLYQVRPISQQSAHGHWKIVLRLIMLYRTDYPIWGMTLCGHEGDSVYVDFVLASASADGLTWTLETIDLNTSGEPRWPKASYPSWWTDSETGLQHPLIFVSEGKHANYSNSDTCHDERHCLGKEDCGGSQKIIVNPGVPLQTLNESLSVMHDTPGIRFGNLGEPENLLIDSLATYGFPNESVSNPHAFCGGMNSDDCSSSISGMLLTDPLLMKFSPGKMWINASTAAHYSYGQVQGELRLWKHSSHYSAPLFHVKLSAGSCEQVIALEFGDYDQLKVPFEIPCPDLAPSARIEATMMVPQSYCEAWADETGWPSSKIAFPDLEGSLHVLSTDDTAVRVQANVRNLTAASPGDFITRLELVPAGGNHPVDSRVFHHPAGLASTWTQRVTLRAPSMGHYDVRLRVDATDAVKEPVSTNNNQIETVFLTTNSKPVVDPMGPVDPGAVTLRASSLTPGKDFATIRLRGAIRDDEGDQVAYQWTTRDPLTEGVFVPNVGLVQADQGWAFFETEMTVNLDVLFSPLSCAMFSTQERVLQVWLRGYDGVQASERPVDLRFRLIVDDVSHCESPTVPPFHLLDLKETCADLEQAAECLAVAMLHSYRAEPVGEEVAIEVASIVDTVPVDGIFVTSKALPPVDILGGAISKHAHRVGARMPFNRATAAARSDRSVKRRPTRSRHVRRAR